MNKALLSSVWKIIVYIFAIIGFIFISVYIAMYFGLTNAGSIIDKQAKTFISVPSNTGYNDDLEKKILYESPAKSNAPDSNLSLNKQITDHKALSFFQSDEWKNFEMALTPHFSKLLQIESETGIKSRLIMSILAVEQLRLFYSDRQMFEEIFAPLKILGSQSQFSWGILGIKQTTAIEIENHLKNKNSEYYLGKKHENILDFHTNNIGQERFKRLINERDYYYQFLYASLYIKQVIRQWENAGFDISNRPEILATLYNIGFQNSNPNPNPKSGGALIEIADKEYSFGSLAGLIYKSTKFPQLKK